MFLYLKRSQRWTWFGARRYILTAHIEATDDERRIIQVHAFSQRLAYIVDLTHAEDLHRRGEAAYQSQKKFSVLNPDHASKIAWANTKAIALWVRAAYALNTAFRVSIDDLVRGTVIEGSFTEVLQTEASIIKTFDALKPLVAHAVSFEQDSETVFEPDGEPADQLAPPSTWPRYSRP